MTKIDQFKILDNKIRANKVQYHLDREAAKIFALSSGELKKFEYLSGEDLRYKPDVIQKAKFYYSPLSTVFNKGLDESDKKEGILKILKNIEGKNEMQLKAIKDQENKQLGTINEQIFKTIPLKSIYEEEIKDGNITKEDQKIFKKLEKIESGIDYRSLYYLGGDKKDPFNFNSYGPLSTIYLKLMNKIIDLSDINANLKEFKIELDRLETKKQPSTTKKKNSFLKNAKKLYT